MIRRVSASLLCSLGVCVLLTGCARPGVDGAASHGGVSPALTQPPEAVKFSAPVYQTFFQDLRADCLNPAEGGVSTPTGEPVDEARMQGYCACYVETFKDRFSQGDLDAYLRENKPLDEARLTEVDQTCSPELN